MCMNNRKLICWRREEENRISIMVGVGVASDQLKRRREMVPLTTGALLISLIVTLIYLINNNNDYYHGFASLTSSLFISRGNSKQKSESCLSREAISSYRKPSPYKPSSYLLTKLRQYEELHQRCGPGTQLYKRTIKELELLGSGDTIINNTSNSESFSTECGYIVWRTAGGLGNQMMTIVSGFLYALLTNRVFLVDFGAEDANLFCEPFFSSFSRSSSTSFSNSNSSMTTTWILPDDFPHKKSGFRNLKTFQTVMESSTDHDQNEVKLPGDILYVNLFGESFDHVKYFHCDVGHAVLRRIPVLVIQSDLYYAPSLFMTPSFPKELEKMFPNGEKATVFHHLGRYLFNPSNEAWEHITDYYNTNLAKAELKIGIQIRVLKINTEVTHQVVMDQILACTRNHSILPDPNNFTTSSSSSSTAILVASLFPEYGNNLTAMYYHTSRKKSSISSSSLNVVKVYQPSADGHQKLNDAKQNMKALVEMYLLSFCDKLVTTGESTFGYVAQGLGPLNPWVLRKPDKDTTTSIPCWRAPTIDPCFHYPPRYDCKSKKDIGYLQVSNLFPFIRICEDRPLGFRLSDGT